VKLDVESRDLCAPWLNRLPFVRWDRFVAEPSGDIAVFGWIDRDDNRADFVLVLWEDAAPLPGPPCYWTSSAAHSKEIGQLLYGDQPWFSADEHIDCERVDESFGDLVDRWVVRS
jgi:hypothetical protein